MLHGHVSPSQSLISFLKNSREVAFLIFSGIELQIWELLYVLTPVPNFTVLILAIGVKRFEVSEAINVFSYLGNIIHSKRRQTLKKFKDFFCTAFLDFSMYSFLIIAISYFDYVLKLSFCQIVKLSMVILN